MYVFSLDSLADRESSDDDAPRFGSWSARQKLLYGKWTTADGTVVLFDRKYRPRWRRKPDGTVAAADPAEWIDGIVHECWLYGERTPIATRQALGAAVLRKWGIGP
jgi:hypothetical protein